MIQGTFAFMEELLAPKDLRHNKLRGEDRAFHDWYRFVLSYPPHLVRAYIDKLGLEPGHLLVDPFCGTGTTLVEAKKRGVRSCGVEAHPMAHFASRVKTNWAIGADALLQDAKRVARTALRALGQTNGELQRLSPEEENVLLSNSISPVPLHKCLVLRDAILAQPTSAIRDVELLALAWVAVFEASNLKFGPEVGVRRAKRLDAAVLEMWRTKVESMAGDLSEFASRRPVASECVLADARCALDTLPTNSINGVITSPPYPNEKDYTRTTRLESVLLQFVRSKHDLRALKHNLVRSNTRNVYRADDDDRAIANNEKIGAIAGEIERRRIALKKTSGFERLYHRVAALYFGGMKRHFEQLKRPLKPGAKLAYVVGDQASYLQVLIRTGELLADIANELGYNILALDLFRTRLSTATGEQLREEVLVLEWPGEKRMPQKNARNRYDQLIEKIFFNNYTDGATEVSFERDEFAAVAKKMKIVLPKNLGDIIYSYRYRSKLPKAITDLLREDEEWVIRSVGRARYVFARSPLHQISPNPRLSKIKILDSTPEVIRRYSLTDEQSLLAIIRYNRLIDIFTGVTCYSLQSHLRTFVEDMGQVETDEIYIGINKNGEQFVFPVQAKGAKDSVGIIQVEQDLALCASKFPSLRCRPIAAQFVENDLVALFEFQMSEGRLSIKEERHYRLVPNDDLTDEELLEYRS